MNLQSKILILLLFFTTITFSQTQNIDVQQYTNNISVTDSNDTIVGISEIEILFTKTVNSFFLDLINTNADGKGMIVSKVLENGETVEFSHIKDKININTSKLENETSTYSVYYSGVPADGLIISQNKYGERTFFADNWPKRARNWFPCVDHPIDKARVIFKVTAPSNYQVIANGTLVEETDLSNENTFYKWKTNVSISTKIMVIGIAKFAVEHLGNTKDIPISSWVYPQNKEDGFYDYAQAQKVLSFFIDNVGPYPFEKLANVQSKTKYGGMENAGNIFYSEASVTGKRDQEDLFAHEIAHQWFGDSASETDWEHLWLSEGFATYFTNLYLETYDVTTIRASTPMYLMARVIKSMGIKMVLSGEGADELFGGYLYFHKAPNDEEFHEETVRKLEKLHMYDCLRANKSLAAWGIEGRVPFLDKEFMDVAMRINPKDKMINGERMEKWVVRKAFEDMIPESVAWRQKEQFSDGVGYSWIDTLKEVVEAEVSDEHLANAKYKFPIQTPLSKEEFYYRSIFASHFPSDAAALCVPQEASVACSTKIALEWDEAFKNMNDPSGRAVAHVHDDAY